MYKAAKTRHWHMHIRGSRIFMACYSTVPQMCLIMRNLSSGLPSKRDSNQSSQLQRLSRNNKISPVASLHMKLSKRRITMALIRLRGCAGWSAPVLFTTLRRQGFLQRGPNRNKVDACRIALLLQNLLV